MSGPPQEAPGEEGPKAVIRLVVRVLSGVGVVVVAAAGLAVVGLVIAGVAALFA